MAASAVRFGSSVMIQNAHTDTTLIQDAIGEAVTVQHVFVDNSANTAALYVHLIDAKTATISGTGRSAFDVVLFIPGSGTDGGYFGYEFVEGLAFATALTFAVSTAAAGTGNPGSSVDVTIIGTTS